MIALSGYWWAPPVWSRSRLLYLQWQCMTSDVAGSSGGVTFGEPPRDEPGVIALNGLFGRSFGPWKDFKKQAGVIGAVNSIPVFIHECAGQDKSRWLVSVEYAGTGYLHVTVVRRTGWSGEIESKKANWNLRTYRHGPLSALWVDADPNDPNHLNVHFHFQDKSPPDVQGLWIVPDIGLIQYYLPSGDFTGQMLK